MNSYWTRGEVVLQGKVLYVVNPASAGKSTANEWPKFEAALKEEGFEFDAVLTEYPGHAIQLTRDALKNGYVTIVAVGGDGTMNEVLNGFYEDEKPINPDAVLAVFSRGTGCDFIRSIKTDKGIESFAKLIKRQEKRTLDVGKVKYLDYSGQSVVRYFMNVSDLGLGGETTFRVNKASKVLKGFLSFAIGALTTILKYKNKSFYLNIDDQVIIEERLNSVIIANGQYFGGGMHVAPNAKMDDGQFDIIILGNLNKLELIKSFPTIYNGTHLSNKKVKFYSGKKITVKCKEKALIEIDGEQPGTNDAEFEIIPQGIKILI